MAQSDNNTLTGLTDGRCVDTCIFFAPLTERNCEWLASRKECEEYGEVALGGSGVTLMDTNGRLSKV